MTDSIFSDIIIPETDGLIVISFDDIYYFESKSNYTVMYLRNKSQTIPRSLKLFEEKLPSNIFIRIHNSYIINVKYLKSIIKTKPTKIILKNNAELPLAESRKENFYKVLDKTFIIL